MEKNNRGTDGEKGKTWDGMEWHGRSGLDGMNGRMEWDGMTWNAIQGQTKELTDSQTYLSEGK